MTAPMPSPKPATNLPAPALAPVCGGWLLPLSGALMVLHLVLRVSAEVVAAVRR